MTQDDDTVQRPMGRADKRVALTARLVSVFPTSLAITVELGGGMIVLGRKPDARHGVVVDDSTVSRQHFAITFERERGVHVGTDMGSSNGSRVDGQRHAEQDPPVVLGNGTVLRIGDVIFVYEHAPAYGATTPSDAVPGASVAAHRLREQIVEAAADPAPVMLIGETGTGKEFIAREIHRLSGRTGAWVAVNCAALSPNLVESQLFGHKKGAFTGADADADGLFRAAHAGTLFLDEIGELAPAMQPKLLRAVQEGEVRPVGATGPVAVDTRIISATLQDLKAQSRAGRYRLDLYARLSPIEIRVPSLRERRADLLLWIDRLHRRWHEQRGNPSPPSLQLSADSVERLFRHSWPENLRGIERVIQQHSGRGDYDVDPVDTQSEENEASAADSPARRLAPVSGRKARPTREELVAALREHGWNVRATARALGRERSLLYRWIERYRIERD